MSFRWGEREGVRVFGEELDEVMVESRSEPKEYLMLADC